MLNSVFGTTKNPFGKELKTSEIFLSPSWDSAIKQLNIVIKYRGMAIVAGEPGTGKSTLLRLGTSELNPKAYRLIYICDVTLSDLDFLKLIAINLGIQPPFFKGNLIRSIRDTLTDLYYSQRIQPILILDDAHLLK